MFDVVEIVQKVGDPETGSLPNGDELRRLSVGISEARKIAVSHCELAQSLNDTSKFRKDQVERISEEDLCKISLFNFRIASGRKTYEVCVVCYVATPWSDISPIS